MSGRKLGGGRILGSGKGLAPPAAAAASPALQRAVSPYAPSDNSTASAGSPAPSLSAGTSNSPSPLPREFSQDLASAINLAPRREPGSSGSNGSTLTCPICEEQMVTLLQLNRHIDDNHQELPEVEQDEVKSWFDKQVLKAKRFQPLSIINQMRGLDVFESNESTPPPSSSRPVSFAGPASSVGTAAASATAARSSPLPELPFDPDDIITKTHWQRSGPLDLCTDPACGKRLGTVNGNINCRKCGRLFCEQHTMYQMKLSRSAAHEPVRGYWYRVCETCYKSRDGYNDHEGYLRDHTSNFSAMRRKRVERQALDISRLEKRLTRLTNLLANPPEEIASMADAGAGGGEGFLGSVTALALPKNQRKAIEQSIVTWEEDAKVPKCPFCQQEFGSWTFRRHHCRLCGRVVCADPQTECSTEIGLNVAAPTNTATIEKPKQTQVTEATVNGNGHSINIDVRMCRECKTTVFSKRDFTQSVIYKPPDQRAYETLRQFEQGIIQILPLFQKALLPLQDENNPPSHAQIQEASKLRKRLTDSFTKYDVAARRLRDLKTDSPTQMRLQKAIYTAGSSFLHMHMLPLKNLPRMLKHSSSASSSSSRNNRLLAPNGHAVAVGSPLRNGSDTTTPLDTASQTGSEASTAVSLLETEEKDMRERLIVLEEQRYMVETMIRNSQGARRFEEVSALTRNVEELDREINDIRGKVTNIEERWQGLYANGGVPPA